MADRLRKWLLQSLPDIRIFKKTLDKFKKIKYNKDTKKTKNKF